MQELSDADVQARFGNRIRAGLTGFAGDMSYFVSMAEKGSLIAYKRDLYGIRREAEEAEAKARTECSAVAKSSPFLCTNKSACGFGKCAFARGDLRQVRTDQPGDQSRPEAVGTRRPTYDLDAAVRSLMVQRGVTTPPRRRR